LKLQNPLTDQVFSTVSDQHGTFAMDRIPDGTYVLHIEGSSGGRGYEATDLLIRLNPMASSDALELSRREAGAGRCGGTSMELISPSANQ
jgi:hypothetical protein